MNGTSRRAFKDELFRQFARIGKALASGRRLELLELLAQKERTVEELARLTDMSVANASQHLQVLRGARLVDSRKDGLYVKYTLADQRVFGLWQALRDLGEGRIAEIERVVHSFAMDRKSLRAVTLDELRRGLRKGSVIVLDVRPAEEYGAGHIPGARSIPLAELRRRLRGLSKTREIVAYCRGPYCVLADEAVALLRSRGWRAFRLEEGFPDWKARWFPVETAQYPGK
ncbi:MAG TPA: metalloregulator ArsR/SmtB family transcription factor [Candidatus Acidoferrales bacterium]|nr:metalloregulator ArsR/SmtB family transcription factor [Candidatus Acidoferrales bacterium]